MGEQGVSHIDAAVAQVAGGAVEIDEVPQDPASGCSRAGRTPAPGFCASDQRVRSRTAGTGSTTPAPRSRSTMAATMASQRSLDVATSLVVTNHPAIGALEGAQPEPAFDRDAVLALGRIAGGIVREGFGSTADLSCRRTFK